MLGSRYAFFRTVAALLLLVLLPLAPIQAQTADQNDTFTFEDMGLAELNLRSPYDTSYVGFILPATWQPNADGSLLLKLQVLMSGGSPTGGAASGQLAGILRVQLNNKTIATSLINQTGPQTLSVSIPLAALLNTPADRRHILAIQLETDERCDTNQFARIIISPSSSITIPHTIIAPPVDLSKLPFPIVQNALQKGDLPEQALLVVPDAPDEVEQKAILTVAAALGRMASGQFQIKLMALSKLTDKDRSSNHLVFVGKATSLTNLAALKLSAPWSAGQFSAPAMDADDGILQMLASPWDAAHVLLIVSANSNAGLEKAAQALSTGDIQVAGQKNLALIAAINNSAPDTTLAIDKTFQALGYASQRLSGTGALYSGFQFEVPVERSIGSDAYLDLSFAHTALIDYNQSGIMINLNDEPIASIRLDDTTTQLGKVRVTLPAELIRPGINNLVIRADLLPNTPCLDPRASALWINLRNDTLLHLPLRSTNQEASAEPIDLKRFPHPFNAATNMSDVLFVLEPNSIAAIGTAAQLAFDIGHSMHGPLVQLKTAPANLPEELRTNHDIVIVGQPKNLPIVSELGAALPLPFTPGSNTASNTTQATITYRSTAQSDTGYIQLLTSPWNAQRSIVTVLGTSDAGLALAGHVLTDEKLRSELSGNLAIIRNSTGKIEDASITSENAAIQATATPIGTATPQAPQVESRDTRTEPTPTPTPGPDGAVTATPTVASLLLMLAAAVVALLLIGVASVVILRRRKRRSAKPPAAPGDSDQ